MWWPTVAPAIVHRDGVFLEEALAREGIALTDVTGVANCHPHFDHSGQNVRWPPGLPISAQTREWRLVHEPDYTVAEWIDVPGLRYELLDGEAEVAPGLWIIPTPGQWSLVVETDRGTVVLAGRAVGSLAEWEGETGPTVSGEPEEAPERLDHVTSVARLRALDPVRVHVAHDPAIWER